MTGGRDRRDARGDGVEDGSADRDLWPGKRAATQPAIGDPVEPGKRSLVHHIQPDLIAGFDGWHADAVRAAERLAIAIAARDFTNALAAASALTRTLELARRAADAGDDRAARRARLRELETVARPLLARAPKPSERALAERFHGAPGGSLDAWHDEERRWQGPEAIARDGVAGAGGPLPHLDRIQASFGRHDVGGVTAHTDGAAAGASSRLGARAFAFGDRVGFAGAPDLHTAAHEAAHVVQQRAGVALAGGAARDGDERHADAVADAVVRGESAEALLDPVAGRGAAAPALQLKLENSPAAPGITPTRGLPGPVVFDLLGDPFEVDLVMIDKALYVRMQYLGGERFTVGDDTTRIARIKVEPVHLTGKGEWSRPFDAVATDRTADRLTFDLYSDSSAILEVTAMTKPYSQIDDRTHIVQAWINRNIASTSGLTKLVVHLPPAVAAGSAAAAKPDAGSDKAVSLPIVLDGEKLVLTARRWGDKNQIALQLAEGNLAIVDIMGALKNPGLRVVQNDGQNISVDLDSDGQIDATLIYSVHEVVHTPPLPDISGVRQQHRVHWLDVYGGKGRRTGSMMALTRGPWRPIPERLDRDKHKPTIGPRQQDESLPLQDDIPGEQALPHAHPSQDWEIRFDGNGDRKKELVLRVAPEDRYVDGQPLKYTLALRDLDSGTVDTHALTMTAAQAKIFESGGYFGPQQTQIADGGSVARITLIPDDKGAPLHLDFSPSENGTYLVKAVPKGDYWWMHVDAKPGTGELTDHNHGDQVEKIGDILSTEMSLGEYGDLFRFTLEPTPKTGAKILGVTAVGPGPAASGVGFHLPGRIKPSLVRVGVTPNAIHFDTDSDGKADLVVSDGITAPLDKYVVSHDGLAMPERDRDHRVRIWDMKTGAVTGTPADFTFRIRNGQLVSHYDKGVVERYAAGAGQSVGIIKDQAQHTEVLDSQLHAAQTLIEMAMTMMGQDKLPGGADAAKAWYQLHQDMIFIEPGKPDAARVKSAKASASKVLAWLHGATTSAAPDLSPTYTKANPYTGEVVAKSAGRAPHMVAAPFATQLLNDLDARQFSTAVKSYEAMSEGLYLWVKDQLAKKHGNGSSEVKQFEELHDLHDNLKEIGKHDTAFRVPATFTADESYQHEDGYGTYRVVPMQLYVWREDSTWYLRDFTNSGTKPWKGKEDASEGDPNTPPRALFEQLNHKRAYPKGAIRYVVPKDATGKTLDKPETGHGDTILCDEHKSWAEHVQDLATALMVVGLILATGGLGVVAMVAFAASAIIGTVGSVMEIADAYEHGYADAKLVTLNVVNIVANLATLGTMSAGKTIATATAKAAGGAEVAATAGLRFAKAAYLPLMGVQVAANAASLLIMADEVHEQLDEIDRTVKDPTDNKLAKAKVLAQAGLMGGLQILALHGDLPQMWKKSPLTLDVVNGRRIVRVTGVEFHGEHVGLDKASADTHATARWEGRELDEAMHREPTSARGRAAKVIAGEKKSRELFAQWLGQDKKLHPDGTVIAPAGASAELVAEMQRFASGGELATHERAFAIADKIRAAGKGLDLDVHASGWKVTRSKLIEILGNDDRARQLVTAFEKIQLGANAADLGSFMAQRSAVTRVVPEAEIDTLRRFYPEGQVYLTGDLARPGAPIDPRNPVIEIVVVAPKDTPAELLDAMEQRVSQHAVHPDKAFLDQHQLDDKLTLRVKVKVVTPEQFAGLATTPGGGRFHKLDSSMPDMIGGKVRRVGGNDYAADAADLRTAHDSWKTRGGSETVSPIHYDPATDTASFDIELGRGGEKIRIKAQIAPRITTAAELVASKNRIVGTPLKSAEAGHAILREVNQGRLGALAGVGVHVPEGTKLPAKTEFGVGKTANGHVLVRGAEGEVDWERLPGIEPEAHTHPDVPENDLPQDDVKAHPESVDPVSHQPRYAIDRIAQTAEPFFVRELIYASAPDVGLMARRGIEGHRVITGFVVHDGFVMKPRPNDTSPRLEFVIKKATKVGHVDKATVYETVLVGEVGGKPVLEQTLWAVQAPDGTGHLEGAEPKHMVHDAPAAKPGKPAVIGDGLPAGKNAYQVGVELQAQVKPELDKLADKPSILVLPANDFVSRYGTEQGRAVFRVEKDGGVIYARPDAGPNDIREEIVHAQQLAAPKIGADIRRLYGQLDKEHWAQSSVRDRMDLYRKKLAIEIDAQNRLLAEHKAGGNVDAEHVADTLANLKTLEAEAEAVSDHELAEMSAKIRPLPEYLEDPAWLFSKVARTRGARPERTAVDSTTKLVQLPKSGKSRSAAYETREGVAAVSRLGDEWTEYTAITADAGGTVKVRGRDIVVTTDAGDKHVHPLEKTATVKVEDGKRVREGQTLAEDADRRYRLVRIDYADGTNEMREEIQRVGGDGWVQRGSESTRRGSIMEIAARAQVDEKLAQEAAKHKKAGTYYKPVRIKHRREGGGFDDVIVIFEGTEEKPRAFIRIREVKDYPDRYVPLEEFTAIQGRDLRENMKVLGGMVDAAIGGTPAPDSGLAGLSKKHLVAIRNAIEDRDLQLELVLGESTNLGAEGTAGSKVVAALRANVKKVLGKDVLKKIPAGEEIERVSADHEEAATATYDAAEAAKTKGTP